ncbi:permease for cytosine/purines, uracil, thiamine, allantoin-domain-containing protein [Hygrophoropsis aurantiaca]|uniref:Permease for cytosine/purines, uracil, thiamine, allantoin-domain-containing protein n=1 Tax=Hygrophoropsis aurantiaca TaxID=72124 RepID=A0ACB8AD33_9AGAM|nr:permease for cytosine/purines, uracil, thiamine, allantoin-domain-containing protein [Hygrophoropsis aurantiaca]
MSPDVARNYDGKLSVDVDDQRRMELTADPTAQVDDLEVYKPTGWLQRLTLFLARWGVETHGIAPIPAEVRVDTRWYQMFFMWFSANMNILAFSTGTVGPAFFSLGVREALIVVLVVDLVSCIVPAFLAVYGPKIGTRAMVQSRFSFGYYGSIIPSALNAFSMQGFLILNSIIGGQTLASVSSHISDNVGIVIISVISLVVTFCGYRIIHWYESLAWIPSVIAFIVMLAVGYPQLHANQSALVAPPTTAGIVSFASTVISSVLSWCTLAADYGVYHSPAASSTRIFAYTWLGLFTASLTGHALGIAFAAAAPGIPSWNAGFDNSSSAGGLFAAVLEPVGGFGKFLTVLVALSIPSACAPSMYSFGTSFMAIHPWFSYVPRWAYVLISEGVLIPVAIIGAKKFYATFVDILSMIGYWSTCFSAIVIVDHVVCRRCSFTERAYPIATWATPARLPRSCPGVLAFLCGCGALVPFMSQVWYVGPVARTGTGDLGVYVGFIVSGLTYAVFRKVEGYWDKRAARTLDSSEEDAEMNKES